MSDPFEPRPEHRFTFGLWTVGNRGRDPFGLEVACNGDLANWTVPGKMTTGMGGAMDLAAGARRVIVLQTHTAKDGRSKLVDRLGLPPTALGCTTRVITELGVFDPAGDAFLCVERAPGIGAEEIARKTGAPVRPTPPAR